MALRAHPICDDTFEQLEKILAIGGISDNECYIYNIVNILRNIKIYMVMKYDLVDDDDELVFRRIDYDDHLNRKDEYLVELKDQYTKENKDMMINLNSLRVKDSPEFVSYMLVVKKDDEQMILLVFDTYPKIREQRPFKENLDSFIEYLYSVRNLYVSGYYFLDDSTDIYEYCEYFQDMMERLEIKCELAKKFISNHPSMEKITKTLQYYDNKKDYKLDNPRDILAFFDKRKHVLRKRRVLKELKKDKKVKIFYSTANQE